MFKRIKFFYYIATSMCGSLGCQHKCQASPTGGTCYCPEGRILANDSRTCIGKLFDLYKL